MNATSITAVLGDANHSLFWICTLSAALVFVALMYSTHAYRPADRPPARAGQRAASELIWAFIPILIVIAAAAPSVRHAVPAQAPIERLSENTVAACPAVPLVDAQIRPTAADPACAAAHR